MKKKINSNFCAIAVGYGDAFFFKRNEKCALIDGGGSRNGFPKQFINSIGLNNIDVLVCTHNDSDHALGLIGFLESGLTANEVWLPSSWINRLTDLVLYPEKFVLELFENIRENVDVEMSLEEIASSNDGSYSDDVVSELEFDTREIIENLEAELNIDENYFDFFQKFDFKFLSIYVHELLSINGSIVYNAALQAASLIRKLFLLAFNSGAKIRWFKYIGNTKKPNKGGIKDFLVPVNSIEILRLKQKRKSALRYLALTTVNKESLVFISPKTEKYSAILFTADSDLTFYQSISWTKGMIITAPHHGSETNSTAYSRFNSDTQNAFDEVIWVRSDGRYKKRPGKSYLNVQGKRYCTFCRPYIAPKQDVKFINNLNGWKTSAKHCSCV